MHKEPSRNYLEAILCKVLLEELTLEAAGDNFWEDLLAGFNRGAFFGGLSAAGQTIVNSYAMGYDPFTGNSLGLDADGNFVRWPDNKGFKGKPKVGKLESGQVIDRIGDTKGRHATDADTPAEKRSLRPGTNMSLKAKYGFVKSINRRGNV